MVVLKLLILVVLLLGMVQCCPEQQCQMLVEEVTGLKEEVAELRAGIRELKGIMIVQHENSFTKQNKANQEIIEAIHKTFEDLKTQMAETQESLKAFSNESESLAITVDWKVTQIKEELSEMRQKTDTSFTAVQDTLGDLEEKAQDDFETLRSETAQLALTVGRNITQIKKELSNAKQNTITNFAAFGVNLTTIKGELVGIKQRTNTSFAAVQDTLGDLEAEQQKVGGGLETLRSETAQLALTVGRNITQIKKELSNAKQNTITNFAAFGVNLTTIKGELVGIKQRTNTSFAAVQDTLGDLEAEQQKVGGGLETLRSETAQLALTVGRNITQIKEELSDVKQNAITNFAAVEVNLTTIKGELVGIKQRTNTGFTAVQDTLGDLEAEQQKVGDGLETLTQIKEELSGGFATIKLGIKMEIEELKNETCKPDRIILSYSYTPISCSEIFNINANSPSGYYQLWAPNGTITTEYCFANSCAEKAEKDPSSPPGYYQLRAPNGTITTEYCFASSCANIAEWIPSSPPGYYQLWTPNGTITTEYCPMECKKCLAIKSTGGWRRVAYLNMTDPTHQCPSGFRQFTEPRSCSPVTDYACTSVTYPVHGIQYQRVCGRVIGYQRGGTLAFAGGSGSIDTYYVNGVSLTHGRPPNRHHIWTFAAATDEQSANRWSCPCSNTRQTFTGRVPDYVGDDYFCDSGTRDDAGFDEVYTEDPLWDGSGCGPTSSCCTFNSPPWFCKELPQPTTNDIELRACHYFRSVHIKLIELYMQ